MVVHRSLGTLGHKPFSKSLGLSRSNSRGYNRFGAFSQEKLLAKVFFSPILISLELILHSILFEG